VELEFSSNRLKAASISLSGANRLCGVPIGRKYIQHLGLLRATEKFSQLYGFQALKLHPLKCNRNGQFAIYLTGNHRLVIEKIQEDKVLIVDVEDYHGD
jgi:plasmid maintenance system killer protein